MIPVRYSVFALLLALPWAMQAQQWFGNPEPARIREGNRQFLEKNYSQAEITYRTAAAAAPNSFRAAFNLGDALYKEEQYDMAAKQFASAAQLATQPADRASALHNLGNVFLKQEKYAEAVEAYKQSLKLKPGDPDTRYNLAYAMSKDKPQNQQQQNQQNQQDQQQDPKDEKNTQDQDSPNKEANRDDTPEGQKANKPQNQQALSKQEIDRMLEALKGQEEDVQKKLLKQKARATTRSQEKDW
jgi:tetratricopeptide (TPR) repeat protein